MKTLTLFSNIGIDECYLHELGIDVVYFLDVGVSSYELNEFDFKNGIVGYGFGLRFFTSGAGVFGIDIGFNPYGTYFIHPTVGN